MIEQGGSELGSSSSVQLRFATKSEAAACIERLAKRLPKSEPIWTITKDAHVFAQAGHY
jgi:hypothetical protein